MHVVVNCAGRVRCRPLAGEVAALEDEAERRRLPGRVAVLAPLGEDLEDLRRVDHAGEIDVPVRGDLRERAENRAGRDHGRRDANAPLRGSEPPRDLLRELLAALRREPGANRPSVDGHGRRVDLAAPLDVARLPQLLEVLAEALGDAFRLDDRDQVLLPRPRVVRPVRRPGPHRRPVADDELVVHQIGPALDTDGPEGKRFDELGLGLRRRRDRDAVRAIEVVEQANVDTALVRTDESVPHDVPGVVVQADIVERELERSLGAVEEPGELARDVESQLAAVGERVQLDQEP